MITATDKSTISKLLGLIGSAHDAEALAAARKAAQLVKQRGATWPQVLGLTTTPATRAPDHLTEARDLLARGRGHLTTWERNFLLGVMSATKLAPKQVESLAAIRAKVDAATMETDPFTD
jgi:hypothetical protein